MSIGCLKKYYSQSPAYIKNVFGYVPPPHKYFLSYHAWARVIKKSTYEPEFKDAYRSKKLRGVLLNALDSYYIYKNLSKSSTFRALIDSSPLLALNEFPLISKRDLFELYEDLHRKNKISPFSYVATTGGTTGAPAKIQMSNQSWAAEWAFVFNYLSKYGITDTDKRLSLRGVRFGKSDDPAEYNPVYRELRISPFHLSGLYLDEIVKEITSFNPAYIHGYPSSISALLELLGDTARTVLKSVRVILCVSEDIPINFNHLVQKYLNAEVISFYGMTERVSFIEYDLSRGVWIPNDIYGVTEIIDNTIVGTGFINSSFPLVRYDTSDKVVLDKAGIIQSIEGRWKFSNFRSKSGGLISMTALNIHSPEFSEISDFQLIQNNPGEVEFTILSNINKADVAEVVARQFSDKCSGELDFKVVKVNKFILTPMGKKPLVVINL